MVVVVPVVKHVKVEMGHHGQIKIEHEYINVFLFYLISLNLFLGEICLYMFI